MERYWLELAVLLGVHIVGTGIFARFEGETPAWRKILKWTVLALITLGAARWIGHSALVIPFALGALGLGVHFWWCRKHGIDPVSATPRKRYYALRGWTLPE